MPIKRVIKNGKFYYQWGDHGKLYPTKQQAVKQMKAAFANGYRGK